MQPSEHIVRQFAYQIWESEGRPDGQAHRHWEMACKLAAGEAGPADPFEPLSNINTYAVKTEQLGNSAGKDGSVDQASQVSASLEPAAPAKAPRSRAKAKVVIDDPDAAPKKRATRSTKKTQPVI